MNTTQIPGFPITLTWTDAGHAAIFVYRDAATGLAKQAANSNEIVSTAWMFRNSQRIIRNKFGLWISTKYTRTVGTGAWTPAFATGSGAPIVAAPNKTAFDKQSVANTGNGSGLPYTWSGGAPQSAAIVWNTMLIGSPAVHLATAGGIVPVSSTQYGLDLFAEFVGWYFILDPAAAPIATTTWTVEIDCHECHEDA